jgi:RNA-binding protein
VAAELTSKQRQHLKRLAHALSPVVRVGKSGFTDAVLKETQSSLKAHELIKVRIDSEDGGERKETARQLAEGADAALVGTIGKVAILYRKREEDPSLDA